MSIFARFKTNSYHIDAVSETRNLKSGKGVLQGININRIGGVGATLIIYDSLTASGKVLGKWDLNILNNLGTFPFGMDGLDFDIGLTYITTGLTANASITIFWHT